MTPEDLAAVHAACFDETPRPWSAAEFRALLADAGSILAEAQRAFALGRTAGPEAELLTLAVHPSERRRGLARQLLAAFEAEAAARAAEVIFLEVAETNVPARALYATAGYRPAGFRRDYYLAAGRRRVGALVLRKALGIER